jgi:hypothetical protein
VPRGRACCCNNSLRRLSADEAVTYVALISVTPCTASVDTNLCDLVELITVCPVNAPLASSSVLYSHFYIYIYAVQRACLSNPVFSCGLAVREGSGSRYQSVHQQNSCLALIWEKSALLNMWSTY